MWNCLFWIFHIGFKTFEIFDILLLFIVSSQTFLIMQRNINEASLYSFVKPALWIMVKLFVLFENWIWLYPFSCSSLTFNEFFLLMWKTTDGFTLSCCFIRFQSTKFLIIYYCYEICVVAKNYEFEENCIQWIILHRRNSQIDRAMKNFVNSYITFTAGLRLRTFHSKK